VLNEIFMGEGIVLVKTIVESVSYVERVYSMESSLLEIGDFRKEHPEYEEADIIFEPARFRVRIPYEGSSEQRIIENNSAIIGRNYGE
jgi:hypothetical protein